MWLEAMPTSTALRESIYGYPILLTSHVVSMCLIAGLLVMMDLRLLGTGLTATPVRQVAKDAQPWLVGGLIALAITGTPTMASTAIKQYYSPFWWWKMEMLALGLIFIFTIRRRLLQSEAAEEGGVWPKVVALVSMGLFLGVTIGARLIGLS